MEEGKDCLVETACRMLALWLFHEELIGLVATFVILSGLLYWGHRKRKRRRRAIHQAANKNHHAA